MSLLVWNPDRVFELSLAEQLNIKLFDHAEIYKQIEPILEHNHKHICDHSYRVNGLRNFLNQHLIKF